MALHLSNLCNKIGNMTAYAVVVLGFMGSTVSAEVLCPSTGVYSQLSGSQKMIIVQNFAPLRLLTASNCDTRGTCIYDIALTSGNGVEEYFDPIQVTDLCASTSLNQGRYSRHQVSSRGNPLSQIYEYSKRNTVRVTGQGAAVEIMRTDYNSQSPQQSWVSPSVSSGNLIVGDVGAVYFTLSYLTE